MFNDPNKGKEVECGIIRISREGLATLHFFLDDGRAVEGKWENAVRDNAARPEQDFSDQYEVYKVDNKGGELRIYFGQKPNLRR